MSFIEVAQYIFKERKQAIAFPDLVKEIANFLELSDEELRPRMLQFYTDLNVNGKFLSLGENRWGLRSWYPVDQIDEEVIAPVKTKKKKAKKVVEEEDVVEDLDDEDLEYDDIEEDFEEDDTEEDESLEALREEEEEEFEDEDIIEDDDYEIEDDEDIDEEEEHEEEEEEN